MALYGYHGRKLPKFTDITEDIIREIALPLGFVDIKVCQ